MKREMRRSERRIKTDDELIEILEQGEYGILATVDSDEQPYGVPVNYVYKNGLIFFHCALEGHKIDNIRENEKVCFTVVGKNKVIADKFTTKYSSVIAFGKAQEVMENEKKEALKFLIERFSPEFREQGLAYIQKLMHRTCVIKIAIEYMSGKRN